MARKKRSKTQASVGFRFICSLISVICEVLLYPNDSELEQPRVKDTAPGSGVSGWG